ncbi:MAG: DUF4384 domain-containing protein [Muribaculaceae bacterium]|nr:DUF4384 domain-containing protein [Muribaculaceae bacterium]
MKNWKLILLMLLALPALARAAGDREVEGEATYYDDGRHSRLDCMALAAEQARVNALAREFGTVVTQDIIQTERVRHGKESSDFIATSMTEVKGEWLGDIGEPKYTFEHDKDQNLIVTCRIRGRARAISNEAPPFETAVLNNGFFRTNETTLFRNGDQMYLYFLGAADGYVMAFLEDESRNVYCLLPYPNSTKGEVKVKKQQEYTFFSPEKGRGEFGQEEELILTAEDYPEYNKLYVMYSSRPFSAPVMKKDGYIPSLPSADFTKWLLKTRRNDPAMGVHVVNLEILPTE